MAGETIKTEAVCLDIRPWSRTSHVVSWLTPMGKVSTIVKGAVRAKSLFLGQYDLNYTCDILYYARAKGELHALRECVPLEIREELRGNYRKLALAGYMRRLVAELAPQGEECRTWYEELGRWLDSCASLTSGQETASPLGMLLEFELRVLELSGLKPDFGRFEEIASASRGGRDGTGEEWLPFSVEAGNFGNGEGRCIRVLREVAEYLACLQCGAETAPPRELPQSWSGGVSPPKNTPLDAARVIGVFYQFHLDCASDVRRTVLEMISSSKEG